MTICGCARSVTLSNSNRSDGIDWNPGTLQPSPTACQFRRITDVRADKSCACRFGSTFQLADVKVYCVAGCTSMWDHLFGQGGMCHGCNLGRRRMRIESTVVQDHSKGT
jgi:hypothetical protein